MHCPCCNNANPLWLIRGNTVGCKEGHKFQIKPVGLRDDKVLVLAANTSDGQYVKGTQFLTPKGVAFRKRRQRN